MAAGSSATQTFQVTVDSPLPAGVTQIANAVTVTGLSCADAANDCTEVTPTPGAVTVSKTLTGESITLDGIAEAGETLTYTITLTNSGGTDVTYAIGDIGETVPANTTAAGGDDFSCSAGDPASTPCTNTAAVLVAAGSSATQTFQVTVDSPLPAGVTQIANAVTVTGLSCADAANDCTEVTPTPGAVTVSKTLTGESITLDGIAEAGETLTYTITLTNSGGTDVTYAIGDIGETVPANTTAAGGDDFSCSAGDPASTPCTNTAAVLVAAGSSATQTFQVTVDSPLPAGVTQIANAVTVTGLSCADAANDCTEVTPTVSIGVNKTVNSFQTLGPGRYRVVYRIDVANTGGAATTYTLVDMLDFPITGVSFDGVATVSTSGGTVNPALAGGTYTPVNGASQQISASNTSIALGATQSYMVSLAVRVDSSTLADETCDGSAGHGLFNSASLSGTTLPSSDACQSIPTGRAAIRLRKVVELGVDLNGNNYGDVGDVLNYAFTISNIGSQLLTSTYLLDPQVTDLVCDTMTLGGQPIQVLINDQIFLSGFGSGSLGDLPVGDAVMCFATHTLTASDVARGRVDNTATATAQGSSDEVVSSTSTATYGAFQ
ncbi:MAG: hypothetical protein R3F12_11700 [Lysobacteraceae bacterium]